MTLSRKMLIMRKLVSQPWVFLQWLVTKSCTYTQREEGSKQEREKETDRQTDREKE